MPESEREVLELAAKAGFLPCGQHERAWVKRFAALVAASEREACARLCDGQHDRARTSPGAARAEACAAAIRARD